MRSVCGARVSLFAKSEYILPIPISIINNIIIFIIITITIII